VSVVKRVEFDSHRIVEVAAVMSLLWMCMHQVRRKVMSQMSVFVS